MYCMYNTKVHYRNTHRHHLLKMLWIGYPLSTLVDLAVREYVYVEIVSVMPDRWYM